MRNKKNSLSYRVLNYKYGETKVVVKGGGFVVSDWWREVGRLEKSLLNGNRNFVLIT